MTSRMIGVLAPYREMADIVSDLQREIPEAIEVVPARITDAAEVSRGLIRSGAVVLVARGGTALSLKSNNLEGFDGIPVVDVPVTAYDVLRAIAESKKKAQWTCVLAYPNMIEGIESVRNYLGSQIEVIPITAEANLHKIMRGEAAEKDICFVGGAITCEIASSCGYQSVLIRSGRPAVAHALREACRIARVQQQESEKRYRLRAVLDSMEDGIIVTDSNGVPEIWNTKAAKLLLAEGVIRNPDFPVALLEGAISRGLVTGTPEDSVVRLPSGAHAVVSVSPVSADRKAKGLLLNLRDAVRVEALEHKVRGDIHSLGLVATKRFSDVVGRSDRLRQTVATAEAFSLVDATVLILGESGTGKEIYAQAIHNASARRNGPYVALNCAALPESLLESELFGYAGGAFTGATKEGKPGLFEMAHKGTLLLDEISELSLGLQGKLLRVLQERQGRRVGGDRVIPIDVRILAATNKDLVGMVRKGHFREDLFFRLDVLRLNMPPLRARPGDIEPLFTHFVSRYSRELNLVPVTLTPEALSFLETYSWPGNVRELQNVVQRCLAVCAGQALSAEELRRMLQTDRDCAFDDMRPMMANSTVKELQNGRREFSEIDIYDALTKAGGSVSKAAKVLGVHRTTLWRRLNKLG